MFFKKKDKNEFDDTIKITALLIHAAKIDEDYTSSEEEIIKRVHKKAKIAANVGSTFGTGGETFMRFNLACPKEIIMECIKRLSFAFED